MANVLDIVIQAKDMASGVMEQVSKTGSEAAGFLEKNWVAVGVASAAAGLAFEGLARQQAPLTEQTRKLAASMAMTEEEVRNMAQSVAGAGDPLNEVLGIMEMGRKQGIRSAEQLAEYASFWDVVGDATGESALALAESGAALRAVGIAAGEESKAIAAMGYIQRETTGTVSEFLTFIGRTGPQLREMGMDVDDAAAVLGVLEREFGMTGRMARTEFNQAVQESEGDLEKLLETLGITTEQFAKYKDNVAASSGVIEENSAIHAESYTVMQELQHAAAELTYQYGDLIGVVGNLSPVLMATGPLLQGIITAKKAWAYVTGGALKTALIGATAKMKAFSVALLANPIGLVLVAIAALAAGAVLLIRNWDAVTKFFTDLWESVKKTFSEAVDTVLEFVQNLWHGAVQRFGDMVTRVREVVADVTEAIVAPFRRAQEIVENIIGAIGRMRDRAAEPVIPPAPAVPVITQPKGPSAPPAPQVKGPPAPTVPQPIGPPTPPHLDRANPNVALQQAQAAYGAATTAAEKAAAAAAGQAARAAGATEAGAQAVWASIPRLAEGGIVRKPTLAMVGEAGPEAIIPLLGNRLTAREMADMIAQAVGKAVKDASRGQRSQEIVLEIDGNRIGRAILPNIIREYQRLGMLTLRPAE